MSSLNRRSFLAASAAFAAASSMPNLSRAQGASLKLSAAKRTLDINGKAASVYGLVNGAGGSGLILDPDQRFAVDLTNALDVDPIIHWHGQIPPNAQDEVPNMPAAPQKPGETRSYDFAAKAGTHWMHSHIPLQEMALLAAPLIVRSADDVAADRQEVVMLLNNFSFRSPEAVPAQITGGGTGDMAGMDMGTTGKMDTSAGGMKGMAEKKGMSGMSGMAMDLNDYNFDAYLTNDRTLSDPDVIAVEANGRVRLRVINGSAATV